LACESAKRSRARFTVETPSTPSEAESISL